MGARNHTMQQDAAAICEGAWGLHFSGPSNVLRSEGLK